MQIGGSGNINRGNSTELFLQKQEMAKKAQDAANEQVALGNSIHTKKEWDNLLRHVDEYLKMVKEEQKIHLKKMQKDAETKQVYAKLKQKERDKNKKLLKSLEENNIKDQILEKKERYMETPEETAKGEYEISDKETGQTYRFKSHIE
ncbi:MAG: hypothetical protein PUB46_01615 [Lachnospiraceae bacterium]|uniref:hypothetical protein n=1 Tax=Roseburia hominis TaxID=301301 RepID=UPI001F2C223E|nr:hypothetical protein [Roseburia hominis]MCI5713787.1 hypothetical protein [Lachnospiraceae bacterium]MDD6168762.1 hypothetical protein [Lachnospiraceae bacterium]MDY4839588.1 hypothetical protein [Lachnospiraceae bacterium]MEE1251240.1 hypothetical protein [Lachnospiraceae bacterium]